MDADTKAKLAEMLDDLIALAEDIGFDKADGRSATEDESQVWAKRQEILDAVLKKG